MAARSTTLTLTAAEVALLFAIVDDTLESSGYAAKGQARVAKSMHAKVTAALIATQKGEGS